MTEDVTTHQDLRHDASAIKVYRAIHLYRHFESILNGTDSSSGELVISDESPGPVPVLIMSLGVSKTKYLRFKPSYPRSIQLSMIVGDYIHNLRASLDALTKQIVQKTNPDRKSLKGINFPFAENLDDLKGKQISDFEEKVNAPGISDVFTEIIRPSKKENYFLWALNKTDNYIKHSAILVNWTVTLVRLDGSYPFAPTHEFDLDIIGNADSGFTIWGGGHNWEKDFDPKTVPLKYHAEFASLEHQADGNYFPEERVLMIMNRIFEATIMARNALLEYMHERGFEAPSVKFEFGRSPTI